MYTIPSNSHVLVCGGTGSGKSYLAERYLASYKYVVKLDTKDETSERRIAGKSPWYGLTDGADYTVVTDYNALDDCETDKIIYVPDYYDQTEDTFNRFFEWIFARQNTIVWIDELMSVATSYKSPRALNRCYTQGRSKNVGIWACSQRPAGIPAIAMSNSDYYFVFNLNNINDRRRLYDMTGMGDFMELPRGHNFWFYHMGDEVCRKAVLREGV